MVYNNYVIRIMKVCKNNIQGMMKRIVSFLLLMATAVSAYGQTGGERAHSVVFGGGGADVLDTYLSPYSYTGPALHLQRQTERTVRTFGIDDICFQTLLDIDCAFLENPAGNVDEYAGGARFSTAWLKHLSNWKLGMNTSAFSLYAGPMLTGYLGGVYNERNGNNPAQGKAELTVDLSAKLKWDFNLLRRRMSLSYQLAVPLIGVAFSPEYGQSYYEAFSLEDDHTNAVFAHVGNMPSMRHLLSLDIPIRKASSTALRLTYAGYFMQSEFNKLRYHSYTHSFMVGVTKYFLRK